jgi:hypothetical protein
MLIKLVHRGHVFCFLQFEHTDQLQDIIAVAEVLLYLFEELTFYCLN